MRWGVIKIDRFFIIDENGIAYCKVLGPDKRIIA
jgi:hypothetical protein